LVVTFDGGVGGDVDGPRISYLQGGNSTQQLAAAPTAPSQKLLLDHRHKLHHRYRPPSLLSGTKEYMPPLAAATALRVLYFVVQYNTVPYTS
jgi:hypothetical protein